MNRSLGAIIVEIIHIGFSVAKFNLGKMAPPVSVCVFHREHLQNIHIEIMSKIVVKF